MKKLAVVALAGLLAGCAGMAPKHYGPPDMAAWRQRLARLSAVDDWRLDGRVAVSNGRQGGSGSLRWTEHAPYLEMRFSGPFGIGGFRLYGTPDNLVIETGKGKTYYTSDPGRTLAERLGWPVPIASMRYWVLGIPDPEGGVTDKRIDQHGLPRHMAQYGWSIDYAHYTNAGGYRLPARLEARRGPVHIKLVINDWKVPAGVIYGRGSIDTQ